MGDPWPDTFAECLIPALVLLALFPMRRQVPRFPARFPALSRRGA